MNRTELCGHHTTGRRGNVFSVIFLFHEEVEQTFLDSRVHTSVWLQIGRTGLKMQLPLPCDFCWCCNDSPNVKNLSFLIIWEENNLNKGKMNSGVRLNTWGRKTKQQFRLFTRLMLCDHVGMGLHSFARVLKYLRFLSPAPNHEIFHFCCTVKNQTAVCLLSKKGPSLSGWTMTPLWTCCN